MSRLYWPLIAFILALCSLSYEFIMIKTLTATVGGRVFNYNLIVSVFTFSLGLGSLYSDKVMTKEKRLYLGRVELLLAAVGILGPLLLIGFPSLVLGIALSFFIGLLSGLELPLLLKLFSDNDSKLIAFDFLGMFLAALVVPLILFKEIGLMPTAILIGCLNLCVAFQLLFEKKKSFIIQSFLFFLVLGTSSYHRELNDYLRELFVWGALS